MKKLYAIAVILICISSILKAQNSPVDDFIKKNRTQKGASYVEMSKTMLDATFANTRHTRRSSENKYPESFKSLVFNDTDRENEIKKIISNGKYDVLMEMKSSKEDRRTKENIETGTTYYFRNYDKTGSKEAVIVQNEGKRLSLILMQGDMDIDRLQEYLLNIRIKLSTMGMSGFSLFSGQGFDFDGLKDNIFYFKDNMLKKLPDMKEFKFEFNPDEFKDSLFKNLPDIKGFKFEFNTDEFKDSARIKGRNFKFRFLPDDSDDKEDKSKEGVSDADKNQI